jgi:hypothetical protein
MEITNPASGSNYPASQSPQSARKNADAFAIAKIQHRVSLVSGLLPSLTPGMTQGTARGSTQRLGLGSDIYTAVGMQTQGMMSRGLTGVQIANVSLGIDMSQARKDAAEAEPEAPAERKPPEAAAPRNYSNPELANPGLGGLLNSLG